MKKAVSSHVIHSPKPIRVTKVKPSEPSALLLTPEISRRGRITDPVFAGVQNEAITLESMLEIHQKDEDATLFQMAHVEQELNRKSALLSAVKLRVTNDSDAFNSSFLRRSCPFLSVPERPTNPMVRDNVFKKEEEAKDDIFSCSKKEKGDVVPVTN